jgi:hypothetical protein
LTPLAVLLLPLAVAPSPTAVAPAPDASAWQFALDSRSVFATLPELHPAIAEFVPIARVAIAQQVSSAKRRLLRIDDMTCPFIHAANAFQRTHFAGKSRHAEYSLDVDTLSGLHFRSTACSKNLAM